MISSGARIGRYEVRDQLGHGGFGVVYTARDTELGRDIALKVLKAEYLTKPQVAQRFLKEARAAASIGHPGIVTVFECGQIANTGTRADGSAYIAMELLRGQSLTDRILDRGRLGIAATLAIGRQLAGALAAAHACGIIHRDLKPDNVYLIPDAAVVGGERVKILDFGVAKLADPYETMVVLGPEASNEPPREHTHSRLMLGTPLYMSPEQAKSAGKVDHRCDIYSLGCIVYELACGRPPFSGDIAQVLSQHRDGQLARPLTVTDMPSALDALIVRMLAKSPDERPATMSDVEAALAQAEREHQREQTLENAPTLDGDNSATLSDGLVGRPPDDDSDERTERVSKEQLLARLPPKKPPPSPVPDEMITAPRLPAPPRLPLEPVEEPAKPSPAPAPTSPSMEETLRSEPVVVEPAASASPAWFSPRVLALALGGLLVGALLTFLLLRRGGHTEPTQNTKITEGPADAAPPVPPPIDAALDIPVIDAPVAQNDIEAEALRALADHRWADATELADTMVTKGMARGADLGQKAATEKLAEAATTAMQDAIVAGRLDTAKTELDKIGPDSVYRRDAETTFGRAVQVEVKKAQSTAPKNCKDLDRYYAGLAAANQKVLETILRGKLRCDKDAKEVKDDCDATALTAEGNAYYSRGSFAAALAAFERAYHCKPDPLILTKSFVAACNSRNEVKAKEIYKKLDRQMQAKISQICTRNGIMVEP